LSSFSNNIPTRAARKSAAYKTKNNININNNFSINVSGVESPNSDYLLSGTRGA
jgi:hypothetical protein